MHSSRPTSCPDQLSQILAINPTGEEFDGSSELKVSSVIINLSNKGKIFLSLQWHFGEWHPPGNWGSFRQGEGKLEDPASVSQEEDWKTRLSATFYTLSSPAVSIWLLPRCQCVRALFQGSRDVLWSKQRSRRIVYELLASPKATKACIFIENSTFISAAFDYRSKDNNNHKKGPLQSHHPRGIQSSSAGSFRAAEKVSLLLSFQDQRQMGF